MDTLSSHVEFLLRHHNCVVMPGFGAFICEDFSASFSADGDSILPPGRRLAFNPLINRNDGMLASSFSRRNRISFEAGSKEVAEKVAHLRGELSHESSLQFGRLGVFHLNSEGVPVFTADNIPDINGALYGLQPVKVSHLIKQNTTEPNWTEDSSQKRRRWAAIRAYASGIAAVIALTLAVSVYLIKPISFTHTNVTEASLAPTIQEAVESASLSIPIAPKDATVNVNTISTTAPLVYTSSLEQTTSSPTSNDGELRFNTSDAFCVVVASFATRSQAEAHIAASNNSRMGILEKDGKFRVYAATGNSYNEANTQKRFVDNADAWICRR